MPDGKEGYTLSVSLLLDSSPRGGALGRPVNSELTAGSLI